MQRVAREMNFSETTFVMAPTEAGHAARVRMFTPGTELPFAGHPTVGTAWVLATQGLGPRWRARVHARGECRSGTGARRAHANRNHILDDPSAADIRRGDRPSWPHRGKHQAPGE